MKTTRTASLSIAQASGRLNMTEDQLTAMLTKDTGQRYHHRTIYSGHIRLWESDLAKIKRLLTDHHNCTKVLTNQI